MSEDTTAAHAFAKLLAVVTELRARCPWDREQKLGDTPRHLVEEAYEVADAVARGNPIDIAEELGDAIVQCLFTGVILAEESKLDLATVMQNAADKLVRRHPHVYGDIRADTSDQVIENWERIKLDERASKNARRRQEPRTRRTRPALADACGEAWRKGAPRRHGLGQHPRGYRAGS